MVKTEPSATELWRDPDRLSGSEAGWLGAAWAICMHAILHFFSLWFDGLSTVLAVFRPAERLAFAVTSGSPPFVRYVVLLAVLAAFGSLVTVVLAGTAHGLREMVAARRAEAVRRVLGTS